MEKERKTSPRSHVVLYHPPKRAKIDAGITKLREKAFPIDYARCGLHNEPPAPWLTVAVIVGRLATQKELLSRTVGASPAFVNPVSNNRSAEARTDEVAIVSSRLVLTFFLKHLTDGRSGLLQSSRRIARWPGRFFAHKAIAEAVPIDLEHHINGNDGGNERQSV